ncbi:MULTISPECIES: DUF4271 domain-containing protein [unclassified Carboxylicivirga]|uniref:DUF4271 domain-containing protein n=1 Tax=Carboxylicivirga TaxID=1628153 RepID=UPI003D33AFDE
MRENTYTYQDQQTVQLEQGLKHDSLATSTQLRTAIKPMEAVKPRFVQSPRVIKPQYRHWTSQDSVFFNLKAATANDKAEQVTFASPAPESQVLVTPKQADVPVKPAAELPRESYRSISVPAPVTIRQATPFEGSKDWLSGFILLALLIAGFTKLWAGKYLNELFSSVRYQQSATRLFSSFNMQNEKPAWALTVLFFLTTALLVFEFAMLGGRQPERLSSFLFFLLVNAGVMGYFFAKNTLYYFVAAVFDVQPATKEYLFNANMLSRVFGVVCLPIVSVVPFMDVVSATMLLKGGLALFIVMYIIQLLRGAKIILHSPLSIFYMFLYFCALEILPLSILIKVMIY